MAEFDGEGAFQGAAAGAAGGSAFGPVGAGVGAGIGLLGGGFLGGKSDNDKAMRELIAAQERLTRDAALRRVDMQTGRVKAMGQQLGAFNPMNQQTAQLMGPEYAFSGDQLASMAQNPMPAPEVPSQYAAKLAYLENRGRVDAELKRRPLNEQELSLVANKGREALYGDPRNKPSHEEEMFLMQWANKQDQLASANQEQQDYIRGNTGALPQGPQPLQNRAAPRGARRAV